MCVRGRRGGGRLGCVCVWLVYVCKYEEIKRVHVHLKNMLVHRMIGHMEHVTDERDDYTVTRFNKIDHRIAHVQT